MLDFSGRLFLCSIGVIGVDSGDTRDRSAKYGADETLILYALPLTVSASVYI